MLPCWCCLSEEVQQSSAPTALLAKHKQHRDSLRLQVWSNRHTTTSRSRVQVLPSPMKPGLQAHLWPSGMLVHVASLLQPPLLVPQWTTAEKARRTCWWRGGHNWPMVFALVMFASSASVP
jgi:hypothetical protein